eukprot:m.282514 g.282514  ORF g.282514 m.282514 type:complete len:94 (+) comp16186_c0_seq16:4145-4426(+)
MAVSAAPRERPPSGQGVRRFMALRMSTAARTAPPTANASCRVVVTISRCGNKFLGFAKDHVNCYTDSVNSSMTQPSLTRTPSRTRHIGSRTLL